MTYDWKPWEGQVVDGKFHLRQYLGGSDDRAVFLTDFGERQAAIKLITIDSENAQLQLSRCELAARLSHPHLIRLFQMGRCHLANIELPYVVMEYAEEVLSQILPQRPLTPVEARDMLVHVVDVLAYLHSNGFVHGHVKPANILAVGDQLKVSSDDLARIGETRSAFSKRSVYDPPEISTDGMSPATDVWMLGMTLVESVTQRLPVGNRTQPETLEIPARLGEPFLDIACHCLVRDPNYRMTVAEIKARLQSSPPVRDEQFVRHELVTPPGPVSATPRRQFVKWSYILPFAVAVGMAAIVTGPKMLKRPAEAQRPAETQSPAQSADTQAPSASVREPPELNTSATRFIPGAVAHQLIPDVPQSARTTIRGTVRVAVRVRVDPSGNVTDVTFDSPGPSRYFAGLALQATRGWTFQPARIDGKPVSSEWILTFRFQSTGTTVLPVETTP